MSTATFPNASSQQAPPEPLSLKDVLKFPIMRRLFYAQVVSVFGDFLALFAVINYLTFKLGATAEQVTNLQIAYLLPIAVLGILAGVFVDRWPLKPTLVASDFLRAGLCLTLLLATKTTHFYLILACISVVSSFFGPAQGVVIRSAVPHHGLRSANVLMQQVMFGMRVIGPGIAGAIYKVLGAHACYWADAASFLASGSLIASLALSRGLAPAVASGVGVKIAASAGPEPESSPTPPVSKGFASIWPDMKQGMSFIVHHAAILFVILALSAAMFVIGCFAPLLAIYVRDVLHQQTGVYAVVGAMIGVGMLLGMNTLNTLGKRFSNTALVYAGLGGVAIGLVITASLPHVWSAIVGNLVIGLSVSAIMVPAQVLIQGETPPALMGRVGSTVMSFIFGAQILGLLASGQLATRIGVREVFGLCAVLLVVLAGAGRIWMEPRSTGSAETV